VAAENAIAIRNLLGKSLLIETKDSGRTNCHACTVSIAKISVNYDLSHADIPLFLAAEPPKSLEV
jgi:hypothetical protein